MIISVTKQVAVIKNHTIEQSFIGQITLDFKRRHYMPFLYNICIHTRDYLTADDVTKGDEFTLRKSLLAL